ncbi:ribonuclease H-like domain-containing protein, partial [Tanacetum coccineum]
RHTCPDKEKAGEIYSVGDAPGGCDLCDGVPKDGGAGGGFATVEVTSPFKFNQRDDKIPTPPPSLKSSSDKLIPFGVTSITNNVPVKLDLEKMNYNSWSSFFKIHLGSIGLKDHIESDTVSSLDKEWSRLNDLVKVWILGTCCESLQDQVVSTPGTAKDLWDHIKDLFHDNEDARAIALDNQLRSVNIGNLSIHDYFSKIQGMADRLKNLGGTVVDKNLVIYALNGLDSRYKHIAKIIRHTKPLPTFATTKTMLLLEETELKDEGSLDRTHVDSSASSPTVLLAPNKNNGNRAHDQNSSKGTNGQPTQFCNYFSKEPQIIVGPPGLMSSRQQPQPNWLRNIAQHQPINNLLPAHQAQQTRDHSVAQHAQFLAAAQLAQQAALLAQAQQPSYSAHNQSTTAGILGPAPNMIPTTETALPSAFSTMTLQDPTWNMDTGASSHLNSNSSNLSTIFNKRLYPSVCVGDGKSIPVTNTGHSILPTLNRPLHLHNVLVTPNIIKNLISVRQFTKDNNCTVEFDAFGFSVKDFLTRHILLRCDSSGDLYPVTQPSITPQAFLSVSPTTWHQRLGHPGEDVLRSLISRQFISCNKEKSPHICHACQLGKHVRLPFSSSNSIVTHCFEIIHSDIWTSPIEFEMTDLGALNYFLGISVTRDSTGMFLSQRKYAMELLERAHMANCNSTRTPADTKSKLGSDREPVSDPTLYRSLAGGLQYLIFTRPDISYVGTLDFGLQLYSSPSSSLVAYTDADWEAEYRGVANVVAETAWIRNLLRELHSPLHSAIIVYCDNVSAIYLTTNPVQHQRTKHIEIDIHFVCDMVARGQNAAEPIDADNLQDLFGPDPRERSADKQRDPKKQKSVDTSSARGSTGGRTRGKQSESVSGLLSQDYRRKCEAAERAYEAKRDKELAMMQCKELEFLMLDPLALPPAKRAIIEKKQAEIMSRYPNA